MIRTELFCHTRVLRAKTMLLAAAVAGSLLISPVFSQSPAPAPPPASAPAPAAKPAVAGTSTSYQPDRFAGRAGRYYSLVWGIDSLSVKAAESGDDSALAIAYWIRTRPICSTIRKSNLF